MTKSRSFLIFAGSVFAILQLRAYAQDIRQESPGSVPILRVNVVSRTAKAINYRHRSGATKIDFAGTALLPRARGEAKVESKQGYIEVEVEFDNLQPASQFGHEYLTYVLWAITPEGRAKSLGEILLNGTKSKLDVSTELQTFGLIVTAEPYFAVSQPSDVVVMENIVRPDTVGKIEEIDAKYELLQRGQYVLNVEPSRVRSVVFDSKTPLELYEARNAVQIAQWGGAERYATESFQKATQLLQQAEDYQSRKSAKKSVVMAAREAAQTAEDARLIAAKRQREEQEAAERAAAQARVDEEAQKKAQAEAERAEAERAKADAEAARREADAARAAALDQQQAAEVEAQRAQLAAQQANQEKERAEAEKAQLRTRLAQQLNEILETRETARGLIVNMSDVLFDTAKYDLRPSAREKLAKIAGIVLAHPGLQLEIEGHTDDRGSEEYNQQLSEKRASAVKDYLVQQGISPLSVVARGYGESMPLADNQTASGRQRNRRVELVVSGESIGVKTGSGG
jgi:outer membrane protein OmpA-like peptidoglycan-associated protein